LLLTGYSLLRGYSLVNYPAGDWRAFILLALIPTVFGHALFNTLLKHLPASMIAMSIVGEPLGATTLAWLIFGDRIPLLWYVGAALVVVGVLAFMRALHRSQSQAHEQELVQMISVQGPVD
ncbi:MAG: EamA family transporter, partial [Firmicutes bacterium]|nr:EamA family transporter [Bacillota bacterium]